MTRISPSIGLSLLLAPTLLTPLNSTAATTSTTSLNSEFTDSLKSSSDKIVVASASPQPTIPRNITPSVSSSSLHIANDISNHIHQPPAIPAIHNTPGTIIPSPHGPSPSLGATITSPLPIRSIPIGPGLPDSPAIRSIPIGPGLPDAPAIRSIPIGPGLPDSPAIRSIPIGPGLPDSPVLTINPLPISEVHGDPIPVGH